MTQPHRERQRPREMQRDTERERWRENEHRREGGRQKPQTCPELRLGRDIPSLCHILLVGTQFLPREEAGSHKMCG